MPETRSENTDFTIRSGKTSTGLSINQAFTPPVAGSERRRDVRVPRLDVFKGIFPDEADGKLPVSTTINKPIDEVRVQLSNVQRFPEFLEFLEKVEVGNVTGQSKWYFKDDKSIVVPMKTVETRDQNLVAWKTEDDAGFDYTMAVYLEKAQADRGTVVRMMSCYESGVTGLIAKIIGLFSESADVVAKKTLQRFKAFCETGHVPTIEGQPSGRDSDSYIITPDNDSKTLKH